MADEERDSLTSTVSLLVQAAENYRDQLSVDRQKATEYSDGDMKTHVPTYPGRSEVVSRDVRANAKKVLPSIIRTILGGEKVVEYQPVGPGDEDKAEQATDFINYVVFPESDGYDAVQDAINDALTLRNGIIRWWRDNKISVTVSRHTGLSEAQMVELVADEEVTVLEQSQSVQQGIGEDGQPVEETIYDVKIRRRVTTGRDRVAAVPPEQFLIHPDALSIEESPLTGINERMRRSELVAMGYDRALIDSIPSAGSSSNDKENEEDTRRRDVFNKDETNDKSMQEVEYYELYVRVDADDDGIAELRRICYAGDIKSEYKLFDEEWDEVPYADLIVERRAHQREGNSVADDLMEIQKIKTVLLRQTLDNLYWQNMPQPIAQKGKIINPDSVLSPSFGKPILVEDDVDVRAAVGFSQVPFVAAQSFNMLDYLDREATDRTGISDASSGMAPDALQNITAKASSMIEAAGIGQTELMVWTIAKCLKRVFKGLLKLTIKHQDKPRVVRLRDQWVTFDPRDWNSEMDCTVNTGLGAGTRERDMAMMQVVLGVQKELITGFGPNNPFVKPENIYNATAKMIEAAGLKTPDLYFNKPTEDEIKAMAAGQSKPDPEMMKIQAKSQADAEKLKADMQLEALKANNQLVLQREKMQQEYDLKRYQIDKEMELKARQNVAQLLSPAPMSPVHIGGEPG